MHLFVVFCAEPLIPHLFYPVNINRMIILMNFVDEEAPFLEVRLREFRIDLITKDVGIIVLELLCVVIDCVINSLIVWILEDDYL